MCVWIMMTMENSLMMKRNNLTAAAVVCYQWQTHIAELQLK